MCAWGGGEGGSGCPGTPAPGGAGSWAEGRVHVGVGKGVAQGREGRSCVCMVVRGGVVVVSGKRGGGV